MRRIQSTVLLGILITGCGDSKNDDDDTGGVWGNTMNDGGGGCEVVEETPIALDATTLDGSSVADMVNSLDGAHEASLTWADATTTDIVVTISDVSNPRFQDFEVTPDASGAMIEIACSDQIVVDIQLSIVTGDGQLNESLAHTATQVEGASSPSLSVDLTEIAGTFDAALWADGTHDELWATLNAGWTENGIGGDISGYGESRSGDAVSLSRFDVATFAAEGF